MSPDESFVTTVNAALADPDVRASIEQMHAENYPLLRMVEALGLEEGMSANVRHIVENLPPDVVERIRKATLDMLNTAGDGHYEMPLNCKMSESEIISPPSVEVSVVDEGGQLTILVLPG